MYCEFTRAHVGSDGAGTPTRACRRVLVKFHQPSWQGSCKCWEKLRIVLGGSAQSWALAGLAWQMLKRPSEISGRNWQVLPTPLSRKPGLSLRSLARKALRTG